MCDRAVLGCRGVADLGAVEHEQRRQAVDHAHPVHRSVLRRSVAHSCAARLRPLVAVSAVAVPCRAVLRGGGRGLLSAVALKWRLLTDC